MFCLKQIPFISKISTFFVLFFMTVSGAAVHSADVILTWDRPNDVRVVGYKVFYGLAETNFESAPEEIINSPGQTSCMIYGLEALNTYGFAAKSFDKNNNESVFSEVIFYDIPATQEKKPNDDDGSDKNMDADSGGGGGCFITTTR
jgi:hypothetical protein